MNETKHLLELAVEDVAMPTPDQIGADVARGRRALRRRRAVQSVFAAAAVATVVLVLPQVVQQPWAESPAPAAPPSVTSTPTASERTTAEVYRTFVAALERYAVPVQGRVRPLTGGAGTGWMLPGAPVQQGARSNGTIAELIGGGTISLQVTRLARPLDLNDPCDLMRHPAAPAGACEYETLPDDAVLISEDGGNFRTMTLIRGQSIVQVGAVAAWTGVMTPGMKLEPPISTEIQRSILTEPGLRW